MALLSHAVCVRLAGGLGNQLFQLAAAMVCARRSGLAVVAVTEGLGTYARPHEATSLRLVRWDGLRPEQSLSKPLAWTVARARPADGCPGWASMTEISPTHARVCDGGRLFF